jgi:alanine racemase
MPTKWVETSVSALQANLSAVKSRLKPECRVYAVVKANGYGHGLALSGAAFTEGGADGLAVTTLEEGVQLRAAGIGCPILLLSPSLPGDAIHLLEHRLTATVCDSGIALQLANMARNWGKRIRAHLKVDTGMGRVGCLWTDASLFLETHANDPGLEIEGIYTHFATAFQPKSPLFRSQRDIFLTLLESLAASGMRPPIAHAANSAALLQDPEIHLDAVRPGTLLYGQFPAGAGEEARRLELREGWSLCCKIAQVKEVPAGWTVGYGAEFKCAQPTRVAVLPVGYADGLTLDPASLHKGLRGAKRWLDAMRHKNEPVAVIHDKPARFLGRVAAQMVCVDVSDIPEAKTGDTAKLPAKRMLVSAELPRIPVP